MTEHPYNAIDQLRPAAIFLASRGLDRLEVLKCITIRGAEILGCDDRLGKIEEGYDADLCIYSGNPLDMMTKVIATIINGEIVYIHEKLKNKIEVNY